MNTNNKPLVKRILSIVLCMFIIIAYTPSITYALDVPLEGDIELKGNHNENVDGTGESHKENIKTKADAAIPKEIKELEEREFGDNDKDGNSEEALAAILSNQKNLKDETEDVIEVRTPEDFNNIRNNLSGNYKLMNDIDLSESTSAGGEFNTDGFGWTPIGESADNPFTGTLDGNGKSIIGVFSKYAGEAGGIIGYNNGTIKNLKCSDGAITLFNISTGGIVGVNNNSGIIENCENYNSIKFITLNEWKKLSSNKQNQYDKIGEFYIGGIVGSNHGTVDMCINRGTFDLNENSYLPNNTGAYPRPNIGGIAGYNDLAIANSVNDIKISITTPRQFSRDSISCVGGIVGTSTNGIVGGSTNNAEIECYSGDESSLGGICGKSNKTSIFESQNTSVANLMLGASGVSTSNDFYVGGICGKNSLGSQISECVNGGMLSDCSPDNIIKSYYAGGIVGICSGDISYSINIGDLNYDGNNKESTIGGIAGCIINKEIGNCYNSGNITVSGGSAYYRKHVGGITGNASSKAFIYQCANDGVIDVSASGFVYTGGLAGALRDSAMISACYNTGQVRLTNSWISSWSYKEEGVGGLAGTLYDESTLWNAYNNGSVSCTTSVSDWYSVGGIVGGCAGGVFGNVYNTGITAINNSKGGSILGYYDSGDIRGNTIGGNWTSSYVVRKFKNDSYSVPVKVMHYYYMKKQDTYDSFNFEDTWEMSDGNYEFPILKNLNDVDYQKEINLPVKLVNSSDADIWIEGYTGDVVDKVTGELYVKGVSIPMLKKSIVDAEVSGIYNKQYTGSPLTQSITVLLEGTELNEYQDYIVIYSNNVNVGTAKMTIRGIGKYEGDLTKTFTIKSPAVYAPNEVVDLPAVKISKPKGTKGKVTVKWKKPKKKNLAKIKGIEIHIVGPGIDRYATAGKKKTSKKFGGLKRKTRYTVQVRAYAYVRGVKHVSPWKTKSAKTK